MCDKSDRTLSEEERDGIIAGHWRCTLLRDKWQEDHEIKAIRAFLEKLDSVPEWMLNIPIPDLDGCLEMCGHRWLDGLDRAFLMIGQGKVYPTGGSCGDAPGSVFVEAEDRLLGIRAWLNDRTASDEIQAQVVTWLGEKSEQKMQAVSALADIMDAYVLCKGDGEATLERHKRYAESNSALGALYRDNWLYAVLDNACGFDFIPSINMAIRFLGGDESCDLACHGSLRHVFQVEPIRYKAAQAALWGLQAYLQGRDAEWLRETKPGLAAGAIRTLAKITSETEDTPAKCWIVASLLKGIKIWLEQVLEMAEDTPPGVDDLPDVAEGLQMAATRFGM